MLIDVLAVCRDEMPAWKEIEGRVRERAARYAAIQERLISPEGTFPAIGRSLAYRFGAFHLLAQSALRRALPEGVSPAQVRGALTARHPPVGRRARHLRRRRLAADWVLRPSARRRGNLHLDRQPLSVLGRPAAARPARRPTSSGPRRRSRGRRCARGAGRPFPIDHAITV